MADKEIRADLWWYRHAIYFPSERILLCDFLFSVCACCCLFGVYYVSWESGWERLGIQFLNLKFSFNFPPRGEKIQVL